MQEGHDHHVILIKYIYTKFWTNSSRKTTPIAMIINGLTNSGVITQRPAP